MNPNTITNSPQDLVCAQQIMGKPVLETNTRILNLNSGFEHKYLCDGPTFSAGTACAYRCAYCYVETIVGTKPFVTSLLGSNKFQDVVIRRKDPIARLRNELCTASGKLKYKGGDYETARTSGKPIVCYGSPLVDIAASNELAAETAEMIQVLLDDTDWDLRLLSKSPLIKFIAQSLKAEQKHRVIFGLSMGTLDDEVSRAIEPTCPSPTQRCQAHQWLQNEGYRTFAMLCPIIPQPLEQFVCRALDAIRPDQCEHIWAEVLNVRGESMTQTLAALENNHLHTAAADLSAICGEGKRHAWEDYARTTFSALAHALPKRDTEPKLRFLQYVTRESEPWWRERIDQGAVLLGRSADQRPSPPQSSHDFLSEPSAMRIPSSNALVASSADSASRLIQEARALSEKAHQIAQSAAELAERSAQLLARLLPPAGSADSSTPANAAVHKKVTPDPKRSDAAKRAWVTIRAKRAARAAAQAKPTS